MKADISAYEQFGKRATQANFQEIAGRFAFQKKSEQYLLFDIVEKLSLMPKDDLLEIGCGAGNLLIPLSFFVNSAAGVDHPNLLKRLKSRLPLDQKNITLVSGDFLSTKIKEKFSKILIYGVVHCLKDEKEFEMFIRRAATLLKPKGKILIGDIPNVDKKARFLASKEGRKFEEEWRKQIETVKNANPPIKTQAPIVFNDRSIQKAVSLFEELGFSARIVPQTETLSFSFTREDILAEKK
ncbi:MAG: SAM-dependent methyltransferase [Candidatus Kaiserbacteria bacterium GW2011_GWB1_52_6]|uniref:SAM-dependent methyltransferase n=2 Tax=Candidatus Kaiseribacteriota TaxID=1752734 RepID=A0A0G1ZTC4_9BACT|nr:MAG: SAM-dependent methyltransferase [Candidatus Kaiserbacteria bacterium GW2011_GWB1_52_6]KKW31567.1 MAG: SAM-dependent methyltransferase [Candidatus Kaiserbacteria bacterium GW2011_GWC2_52_8b]